MILRKNFLLVCLSLSLWILPLEGDAQSPVESEKKRADGPETTLELQDVAFGFDLVPYIGTSSATKGKDVRRLSFNLVGYAGAVDGIEVGLLGTFDRFYLNGVSVNGLGHLTLGPANGVQIGGAFNLVGTKSLSGESFAVWRTFESNSMSGVQVTGAANLALGDLSGVQVAGATNVAVGRTEGAQIAGGANFSGSNVRGAQLAGGANLSAKGLEGAQIAGGGNVVASPSKGVQVAGGANIAASTFDGAQIAGGGNVAAGSVGSSQIAGGLNIAAGKVDGVQVGVVNIAEESDFSLGVLNILWNGRTHLDVWGDEMGFISAGVKNGGDYFHYLYFGGYRTVEPVEDPLLTAGLGLGGHLPLDKRWSLNLNLLASMLTRTDDFSGERNLSWIELLAAYQPAEGIGVEFGPTYRIQRNETPSEESYAPFGRSDLNDDGSVHGWPGFKIGLEFF
jgi:uncharacterized protein YjbI with pentapeptide repeats